MEIGVGETGN